MLWISVVKRDCYFTRYSSLFRYSCEVSRHKKSSVLFTLALYLHFPFTLANDGKYIQIDDASNIYYE